MNYQSIKSKIFYITIGLIIIIVLSSRFVSYILTDIEKSFHYYSYNASNGEIALLNVAKDLNYISGCSRDIMLGGKYDKNMQIIKSSQKNIYTNLEILHKSLQNTKNEKLKLELFEKSKKYITLFVDDVIKKMDLLKDATIDQRLQMFDLFHKQSSPLAKEGQNI